MHKAGFLITRLISYLKHIIKELKVYDVFTDEYKNDLHNVLLQFIEILRSIMKN